MGQASGKAGGRGFRTLFAVLGATVVALVCAPVTLATSLTAGDVVVERDGNGTEALSGSAGSVFLDEFEPNGNHVAELAFPTSANGSNKPLLDSGSATSDGLMTLSANSECLLAVGYDAPLGTEHVTETPDKTFPRVVAVVNGQGEINTTTGLTDFANENNARSAASNECKKLYVGGNGTKTTGGVVEAELGKSTGTQLDENVTNIRQVEVVDGQLYADADPTKGLGVDIAKVGSGLPTTAKQTITNLPFETAPEEPYAYSMLTLGLGSEPDTIYVADNKRSAVVKYGLHEGKWVEHGLVEVPEVTGVTANDVGGVVTIYATSAGTSGKGGTLYRISDVSGVNGTLSGIPVEVATAPANEAWRGVAFAPGTTIGSGGTPPAQPSIVAAETTLPAAIDDPTNRTMPITVGDPEYAASELKVSVRSSKESVAPVSGITVTGTGTERTVTVTPEGVGITKLTFTVEAPNGAFTSTQISYGASEFLGDLSDRYYSQQGAAGSAIDVGGGYMIVASDESNTLALYREGTSAPPVKTFDFDGDLPYGAVAVNIHSSARAGNTIYWVGGFDNTNSGEAQPARNTIFAATITGSGASTELTYVGSYTGLREDLVDWDNANGAKLGLAKSAASGQPGEQAAGFKIEGVEFAPGSSSEAYLTLRAPLEPACTEEEEVKETCTRHLALVIPVTNFSELVTDGNPGTTKATFGTPLEWNLGGLSIRQIRKNAGGEYIIIASTATSADTVFQLWGWDGETEDEPVLLNAKLPLTVSPEEAEKGVTGTVASEGVWDALSSTPEPIADGDGVEVLQDDSKIVWYGSGTKDAEKGLLAGLQKFLGRPVTVEIPAPGTPEAPYLSKGKTPNKGEFTLKWKPAPTLRARFTLQHQNAEGGWTTFASGLSKREYTFTTGEPENEGTWTYRVSETNETGTSEFSKESAPIKVDKTPPRTPTATASRAPDYSGGGGWYKNSVEVKFTSNGDPNLSDGSLGSGVNPATLTEPETFDSSGIYEACGTVADYAENVSKPGCLTVQVDATPPSLELTCPATALISSSDVNAMLTASDAYSGLETPASETIPINTSVAGPQTITRTAKSHVGLETTKSCTTDIIYPTPGAPALTEGVSPNNSGDFTLGWTGDNPMQYMDLTYTLQAHDAATETWTTVASGIESLSFAFSGAGEEEGTWVYRVKGVDTTHEQTTPYSPTSSPVVVDKTPPNAPSATPSRAPDYSGGGGWYKNSVEVKFSSNGDPKLSDGSPGSGVIPASIPGPETFASSGSHTACATATDYAGNVSQPGCVTVQVDATPPTLEIECPATVPEGAEAHATVTASDAYSGLASNPSGEVPIDTSNVGSVTITRTAISHVGYETTKSCTTRVLGSPPEFGRCKKAPEENGKPVAEYGNPGCTTVQKKHKGKYEWESGVGNVHFSSQSSGFNLETANKTTRVSCGVETSTGEFTGDKTIGNIVFTFTECTSSDGKCESAHEASGKIITNTLEGKLGVYKEAASKKLSGNKLAIDLLAEEESGALMSFTCEGKAFSVQGSVVLPLTTNKMEPPVLVLEAETKTVKSKTEQKWETFDGSKHVLELSVEGGAPEAAALSTRIVEELPEGSENFEANSVE